MKKTEKIVFIPSNDTHVHWMLPIASQFENSTFMVIPERNEDADTTLQNLGFSNKKYKQGVFKTLPATLVVLGVDWGKEEQEIIRECRILGVRSICIQEGPLHFSKSSYHLQNADLAFIQGEVMRKYIGDQKAIVTGNPKYDQYQKMPLPEMPCVMINCNFTYGIYEDYREQWVNKTVEACKAIGIDYFISKHPRDTGKLDQHLPIIKSNAFLVKDQLEKSSILISRFSTLIYEALLLGREVIYYDPMHEKFSLIKENNNGAIRYADDYLSLDNAINQCLINPTKEALLNEFLDYHCNGVNKQATQNCVKEINRIQKEEYKAQMSIESNRDASEQLVNYLIQNEFLSPSDKHVEELHNSDLPLINNNPQIIQFLDRLADRSNSKTFLVKDLGMIGFELRVPQDSVILIPDGMTALREFEILADPLNSLAKREKYIVLVDDINKFKSMSEIKNLANDLHLPLDFIGYGNDCHRKTKFITILANPIFRNFLQAPNEINVVALISTFNEIDIISQVIKYLNNQNIAVYVMDNWSTDGTFEVVEQMVGEEVLGVERWPKTGPTDTFDLRYQLMRKEALTEEIDADWFMHYDADEIRSSPWPEMDLKDAIYRVDQEGYNAIDFSLINFFPIDNSFSPDKSLEDHFEYFEFGSISADFIQIKAWKKTTERVNLVNTGGHSVEFKNRKVYPINFLTKHFHIRSQEHGVKKVFKERKARFNKQEKEIGWHVQYDSYSDKTDFLKNKSGLIHFDDAFRWDFLIERLSGFDLQKSIENQNQKVQNRLNKKINNLEDNLDKQNKLINTLNMQLIECEQEVLFYASSKSWWITRPMRKFATFLKKLKNKLRIF